MQANESKVVADPMPNATDTTPQGENAPTEQTPARVAVERRRIDEETLFAMGSIYCRKHHPDAARDERGVCAECADVIEYSLARTSECPHEHKGTCKTCSIHCYRPEMRAAIREIMRYGAPRMIYRHPALTTYYVAKTLRERRK